MLRRALEAACDQARSNASSGPDARPDAVAHGSDASVDAATSATAGELAPTFAQRQADAMGVIAESALAGGLDRGTAGDRYQVVVHVDADALVEKSDVPAGTSAASYAPGTPRRRHADVRRIGLGRGKRPAGAAEDISPLLGESPGDLRRAHTLRAQPDRAGRGGRDPRRSRDGPAGGLRQCNRDDAPRPWRRDSGRRPQDTHDLARVAPGACVPRRAVPVPRVSESPLRFAPRSALGRRRRDGARQSRAVVPATMRTT